MPPRAPSRGGFVRLARDYCRTRAEVRLQHMILARRRAASIVITAR
jgi:hypothetical protein